MKTSVELEKEKIELAKKLGSESTLRELLDRALDSYIAEKRREQLSQLLGTDFFGGDLNKMRKRSGRK